MEHIMEDIIKPIILSIGIIVGCFTIGSAIQTYAYKDRSVQVKGLSEREVLADKVIWPLPFNEVGNDMLSLTQSIESKQNTIISFLKEHGVTDDEIICPAPSILDRKAQQWGPDNVHERYQTSCVITVVSTDVKKIMAIMQLQQELLRKGIAVGGNSYDVPQTQYLYTSLNDLKPSMVEEATRNARQVAEKFAADADCSLGSIRNASQGQFSITEEPTTPHIKKVRVVTTIDYYLK